MPGSGVDGKMRQDDGGRKKAEEFTSLVHVRSGTPMMVPVGLTPENSLSDKCRAGASVAACQVCYIVTISSDNPAQ